jgi:DNA-binding MarR family transcriptional regulator
MAMMPDQARRSQAEASILSPCIRLALAADCGSSGTQDIVDRDNELSTRRRRGRAGQKNTGSRMAPGLNARSTDEKPRARRAAVPVELGALNDRLGYFVRRLQVWIFQDFIKRLSRLDLSPAQFSVIVVIGANPGLSQAELAATLGIERARLVRLLHRLEKRGLTERRPSSADGRRHALILTRGGEKLLAEATRLAEQHEDGLKQKLGARRHKMLLDTLRAF